MDGRVLPVLAATGTVLVIVQLLRRRRLREKYAVLWLAVAVGVALTAALPAVLTVAADLAGVRTPSNLLFFVAALVLLIVSVQLSAEITRLEDETRCLAEELALLRIQVEAGCREDARPLRRRSMAGLEEPRRPPDSGTGN